jgi:hypothetical protein
VSLPERVTGKTGCRVLRQATSYAARPQQNLQRLTSVDRGQRCDRRTGHHWRSRARMWPAQQATFPQHGTEGVNTMPTLSAPSCVVCGQWILETKGHSVGSYSDPDHLLPITIGRHAELGWKAPRAQAVARPAQSSALSLSGTGDATVAILPAPVARSGSNAASTCGAGSDKQDRVSDSNETK